MATQNINPANNPLAQSIQLDTLMNGQSFDEDYEAHGPYLQQAEDGAFTATEYDESGKSGILKFNQRFGIRFYLPRKFQDVGDIIYMVPAKLDENYENGIRDFTESSQLDQPYGTASYQQNTWRQDANRAIVDHGTESNGAKSIEIMWSVVGEDTNRNDLSIFASIKYKALIS